MFEIKILSIMNSIEKEKVLPQVEAIFFESSSLKSFSSPERRAAFYKRWCGDYQNLYPQEFFIATENDKVMGYLSGCSDSMKARDEIEVPGFSIFEDLFSKYPAHLHINFHPDSRGKGLGTLLVKHYIADLKKREVKGVHLVTSDEAKNISFYERLGFVETHLRRHNEMNLYFMGLLFKS